MKTFYNVVNAIICCVKEACASIVLDAEWVQFVLQNCQKLQNYGFKQDKKEQILSEVCMIKKKRLIVLFTSDVRCVCGLHATRFVAKIYLGLTCKVNLSNTKNPGWFFILASLLDRGMECVNWLPPRTIVCFIKLYFGAVQLSIVSQTELLERLWIKRIKLRWWATVLFCLGIDQFG